MGYQGDLNRKAGITNPLHFVGVQKAANMIAGTTGLGTQAALNHALGITDWREYIGEYAAAVRVLGDEI